MEDTNVYKDEFLEENQVEQEEQGSDIITMPFNPTMIRIRRDPFTLGQLIDKMQYKEIKFDTPFQRKAGLWDAMKQSRLIESILLRLPLPAFYFDETDENKQIWNVIDGLQRCSVFQNFIVDKKMTLVDLEFLGKQYNGSTYSDLPRELQRRIMQTALTVYVIESGTPEEVKFNIFKRINTGGLILTPQEIRHAMNQGVAADFVAELAQYDEFLKATCHIIKKDRMEDRDFITRFIAFYLQGYLSYQPDLDSFMTKGMSLIKKLSDDKLDEIRENFKRAMNTAWEIFGNDAFRKRMSVDDKRKPINKALFEVLSVSLAKLTDQQCDKLIKKKKSFKQYFIELNHDTKFRYSLSSGTGQKDSVILRFTRIGDMIYQILNRE